MEKRVLIFGSYVTDLSGRVSKFPKEGETLKGNGFKIGPGGKGSNQAVAAKRAGASVTFVSKIGSDMLGVQAQKFYEKEGLWGRSIIVDSNEPTGAALIIVNESTSQNMIAVFGNACENFTAADIKSTLGYVDESDILLLQLETNMQPIEALLKHAKGEGVLTVLNPAPAQTLAKELFQCVDIITPNETEALFYTGVNVVDEQSARLAARKFMDMGVGSVVITMGSKGCYAQNHERGEQFNTVNCGNVIDTTGAGDAFSGGFVAALSRGFNFFNAVVYGSIVAGISVTRYGTAPAMPYREEIEGMYQITKNMEKAK